MNHSAAASSNGGERHKAPPPPMTPSSDTTSNQKPPPAPPSSSPSRSIRKARRAEAAQVLDLIGEHHLDGFNLLGVVANPRGTNILSTTHHGNRSTSTADRHAATSSSYLYDPYTAIASVSESVEGYWNAMLEEWSRSMLEDADGNDDTVENILERPVPPFLSTIDTASVTAQLQQSGSLATLFRQRVPDTTHNGSSSNVPPSTSSSPKILRSNNDETIADADDDAVPNLFFEKDLDLADPTIFGELLLAEAGQERPHHDDDISIQQGAVSRDDHDDPARGVDWTRRPVTDWLVLRPPDHFGPVLDHVELALLSQVRARSSVFFAESVRFGVLQQLIQQLLSQTTTLQGQARHVQRDYVEPFAIIPRAAAHQRELRDLLHVMDQVSELLDTKHSIAGLLSAQDDLNVIAQIQYGRVLLHGGNATTALPASNSHADEHDNDDDEWVNLTKLQALQGVAEQLSQYEKLVVTNLREELVELFVGWNNTNALYGTSIASLPHDIGNHNSHHERVLELWQALHKCHGLSQTRQAYQTRLQDVMRLTVRTIVSEFTDGANVATGASTMAFDKFMDCLHMMFEQLLDMLSSAVGVDDFCMERGLSFVDGGGEGDAADHDETTRELQRVESDVSASSTTTITPLGKVNGQAADLATKSVSELLRMRKNNHTLSTLDDMKRIWDVCHNFMAQIERLCGHKCTVLHSTLITQAKGFTDRKQESNMSSLATALDAEQWKQCQVSAERQEAMTRLCSGRSVTGGVIARDGAAPPSSSLDAERLATAEVEGTQYKVVWSCLLLIEMALSNIAAASYFPTLAASLASKTAELLRLFNSRTTHLVLGAGARHTAARLKTINARHLALTTQSLSIVLALMPYIRGAFQVHMPSKQHSLLSDLDKVKAQCLEHLDKVLNKFVSIVGGLVEFQVAPTIKGTSFDARAQNESAEPITCCTFLDGISSNVKKLHQVLLSLLRSDHFQDVFSRIFSYLDHKVPTLFISAAESSFHFPGTNDGKRRMLLEVHAMTMELNGLQSVQPWDFTAIKVLERRLEYSLDGGVIKSDADPLPTRGTGEERPGTPPALVACLPDTPEMSTPARNGNNKPDGASNNRGDDSVVTNDTGITTDPGPDEDDDNDNDTTIDTSTDVVEPESVHDDLNGPAVLNGMERTLVPTSAGDTAVTTAPEPEHHNEKPQRGDAADLSATTTTLLAENDADDGDEQSSDYPAEITTL